MGSFKDAQRGATLPANYKGGYAQRASPAGGESAGPLSAVT
jgi:hypothetical protein